MKHTYEKPVITLDAGMAEGVYAASGAATTGVSFSDLSNVADWGNNNGQKKFTLDLSNLNPSLLTVVVSFNNNIDNGWGGGAGATVSGSQLTLSWHSAPSSAEIIVQVSSNFKDLKITGATYSNK